MFVQIGLLAVFTHMVFQHWEPKDVTRALTVLLSGSLGSILFAKSLTASGILVAVATFIASLCLSVVFYRVSPFHPLAQYPGPILNKITQLAPMWTVYTGHQHLTNHKLHAKYGPIVRIGPNDLSIVDVDAVNSVLGAGGLPKGQYYNARQIPNAPQNIIGMRGEAHAARRKLWNRGFSPESLQGYEAGIARRASQVVNKLNESVGKETDLVKWINYFAFDVMGEMAFGRSFNMITEGDKGGIWDTLGKFALQGAIASHIPWARGVFLKVPMFSKHFGKMRQFGMGCAMQRMKSEAKVKDLWYYLSDEAGIEKVKPAVPEVSADGTFAVVAGSDTTASALSSLFWFLIMNPDVYKKVQEEIDTVYPDYADPLNTARHAKLVYLNACINETLRLHPPIPTNGPRQVPEGTRGKLVAGRHIPEGTQVYVPPYSMHRDPRYFSPEPESFIPDRWLSASSFDKASSEKAFIPFSYGPANCVGRQMAKNEMLMFASVLLQHFTFQFAPGFGGREAEKWPERRLDYLVTTRAPLLVRAKPRNT
ncbi:unnamed protein product [Somion occarium]|uniref:Cytochrome P450 n=1 Tax=Somion occarium TaxID=3059160 RepID=A0ABP1DW08_9APHY